MIVYFMDMRTKDDEKEAARAYNKAVLEHRGEFAVEPWSRLARQSTFAVCDLLGSVP